MAAPAPAYDGPVATRKAFGDALVWIAGHRPDLVVLDGEVGNSTYTEDVERAAPERFVQLFIAEQCMVGVQTGMQALETLMLSDERRKEILKKAGVE